MHPGVIAIAALGGYVVYDKLLKPGEAATSPDTSKQVSGQNAWPSWLNIGNQPTAGNGPAGATDNSKEVASAIAGVANLTNNVFKYFTTADKGGGMNAGQSAGASSTGDFDSSGWAMPNFPTEL